MTAVFAVLFAAMTSADAVVTILNSSNSVSARVYAEAKRKVAEDAAKKRPLQQFVHGIYADDPAVAKKCLDESRPLIRAMAERYDNPLAWYLLSMEKNDFTLLKRAADGGNVQALNAIGTIATTQAFATKGLSTNQVDAILRKSFDYFNKAAAQRDANAFINLGTCYQRGLGCRQDLANAFVCFMSAAEMGHPEGMDYVSACYQFGHGTERDDDLSLLWRMRAKALRGDKNAAEWLRSRK